MLSGLSSPHQSLRSDKAACNSKIQITGNRFPKTLLHSSLTLHSHSASLVDVLPGEAKLEPVGNICHLLDHLLDEFLGCVVIGAGSDNLEKTVLDDKAAVIERAVL